MANVGKKTLQIGGGTRSLQPDSCKTTGNSPHNSESREIRGHCTLILANAPANSSRNSKSGADTRSLQPDFHKSFVNLLSQLQCGLCYEVPACSLILTKPPAIPLTTPTETVLRGRCGPILANSTSILLPTATWVEELSQR